VPNARGLREEPSLAILPEKGDQPVAETLTEPRLDVVAEVAPHGIPAIANRPCVGDEMIGGLQEEVLRDGRAGGSAPWVKPE
jgi:hypothetical protein